MVTKDDIKEHFKNTKITVKAVLDFCRDEYENDIRVKKRMISTDYLEKLVRQIVRTLFLSNEFGRKVQNALYDLRLAYRTRNGMSVKKAPIFHPIE